MLRDISNYGRLALHWLMRDWQAQEFEAAPRAWVGFTFKHPRLGSGEAQISLTRPAVGHRLISVEFYDELVRRWPDRMAVSNEIRAALTEDLIKVPA